MKAVSIFRTRDLPKVGEIFYIKWLSDDKTDWYLVKRREDVIGTDDNVRVVLDFTEGGSFSYRTTQLVGARVKYLFSEDLNTPLSDLFD